MAVRIFCRLMPASSSRLTTLSWTRSVNEYSRCDPEPWALWIEGRMRPVLAQ